MPKIYGNDYFLKEFSAEQPLFEPTQKSEARRMYRPIKDVPIYLVKKKNGYVVKEYSTPEEAAQDNNLSYITVRNILNRTTLGSSSFPYLFRSSISYDSNEELLGLKNRPYLALRQGMLYWFSQQNQLMEFVNISQLKLNDMLQMYDRFNFNDWTIWRQRYLDEGLGALSPYENSEY